LASTGAASQGPRRTPLIYKGRGLTVCLGKSGANRYAKASYPLKYGLFSEVETEEAILQFNLNDEIVQAKGRGREWPDPQEWLKRTVGNDWIYYSTGGYAGVFEAIGEYYLPNTPYPTNALIGGNPHALPPVARLVESWHAMLAETARRAEGAPEPVRSFFRRALANTPQVLQDRAEDLFAISGGRVTVLPPDARHVDYNVIPLTVAEGCLYKCRFCRVKTDSPFRAKEAAEITQQIQRLKGWYGPELANCNALFLGEHDALCAGADLLNFAISEACVALGLFTSVMQGVSVFLFGSVGSLLNAPAGLFEDLNRLPVAVYINIGLESADQATLDRLGKPVTSAMVAEAFTRMQDINDRFDNIEITANFIMDDGLPENHLPAFLGLVRDGLNRKKPKDSIYLSPLRIGRPSRSILFEFNRLKLLSRLPTFLYIIQRL
jgi:radical SAM superfamily enzyme YgiQ (UPF0313 family)